MLRSRSLLFLCAVPALAYLGAMGADDPVHIAATSPEESGVLRFEVRDEGGQLICARLTFLDETGAPAEIFPAHERAPRDWAVRGHVVSNLAGEGALTIPPGRYEVIASRGLEWSLARNWIEVEAGQEVSLEARLVREIDTTGWVSGDYHLHTLTFSGHGDANVPERLVSLIAEGLEFAVATDHNHNTDYAPVLRELGASDLVGTVTGNEVSVPLGHFNVFPLDPESAPVASDHTNGDELFRLLRAEENRFDIEPVIQVNHPRWRGIDYFTEAGLDPVTGTSSDPDWSLDFDSIEVLNENVGWGWYDPATDGVPTRENDYASVRDWFHLLNRGHRAVAVGNSDSHTVRGVFAGYPRNFTRSPTDRPAEISPVDVARALRAGAVSTTLGPFVEMTVNGKGPGATVSAPAGEVEVNIRIQAASWIDCDRVRVIWNGEVLREIPVPGVRSPLRLDDTFHFTAPHGADGWIALLVDGDTSLAPLVTSSTRDVLPFAIVNPVRVDANEDGVWTSPFERAQEVLAVLPFQDWTSEAAWAAWDPVLREMVLGLAEGEEAIAFVRLGLIDVRRSTRLAAARCAERLGQESLATDLEAAAARAGLDAYEALAILRARHTCGKADPTDALLWLERYGSEARTRYGHELEPLLTGTSVTEFVVLGPFEALAQGTVQTTDFGPETQLSATGEYIGKNGTRFGWTKLSADDGGYLDLNDLAEDTDQALAYAQTWLHVDEAKEVLFAFGTDDGSRVYLGKELVYDDPARRGADPFEHIGPLSLKAGWNRLLFKVENGTGGFGLYLRILTPGVRTSPTRP